MSRTDCRSRQPDSSTSKTTYGGRTRACCGWLNRCRPDRRSMHGAGFRTRRRPGRARLRGCSFNRPRCAGGRLDRGRAGPVGKLAGPEGWLTPAELLVNEVRSFLQVWFEHRSTVGRIRVPNNHHIVFRVINTGGAVATTGPEPQSSGVTNGSLHLSVDQIGELISCHPRKISDVVRPGVSVSDFLGGPH